ncbi:MAG: hypothetical protein M5U26_20505 [Planctomycetota bacterium]|nr:hypothetical protein [Planctomycetota bacterium]
MTTHHGSERVEVRPLDEPRPARRGPGRFGGTTLLMTGLVVGLLAGGVGLGVTFAAGKDSEAPRVQEQMLVTYTVDPRQPAVKWADWTSAPDTFLAVRFQSDPETVYVTPVAPDDAGFPHPVKVTVPRAFANGEKAYVYLFDDDTLSDKLWKDLSQQALKNGGAAAGRIASLWTLGQVPSQEVIAFCDRAGEKLGELTLDANDCLGWTEVALQSQPLDFAAEAGAQSLLGRDGAAVGAVEVVFGH